MEYWNAVIEEPVDDMVPSVDTCSSFHYSIVPTLFGRVESV